MYIELAEDYQQIFQVEITSRESPWGIRKDGIQKSSTLTHLTSLVEISINPRKKRGKKIQEKLVGKNYLNLLSICQNSAKTVPTRQIIWLLFPYALDSTQNPHIIHQVARENPVKCILKSEVEATAVSYFIHSRCHRQESPMGASQLPAGCQAAAQILGVHTRVGGIRLLQHQPTIITSHQSQRIIYTNLLAVSPRLRQPTSPR
jgi:hypothetical protein